MPDVTYDRPQKATLHVHLADGTSWKATPEDLRKFDLVVSYQASTAAAEKVAGILANAALLSERHDLTDAALSPVRYLYETMINYPHLADDLDHGEWADLVLAERVLRASGMFRYRDANGTEHNPGDPDMIERAKLVDLMIADPAGRGVRSEVQPL